MRYLTFLIVFLGSVNVTAQAQAILKRPVQTLIVTEQCHEVEAVVVGAAQYYKAKHDIDLELICAEIEPHIEPVFNTIEDRMSYWQAVTRGTRKLYKADLGIVFIPFLSRTVPYNFEMEMVMGIASGIGVLGHEDAMVLSKILPDEQVATKLLIHELGHALGAWHSEYGIMAPSLQEAQSADDMTPKNYAEIRAAMYEWYSEIVPD